jgi:hypothetical protein
VGRAELAVEREENTVRSKPGPEILQAGARGLGEVHVEDHDIERAFEAGKNVLEPALSKRHTSRALQVSTVRRTEESLPWNAPGRNSVVRPSRSSCRSSFSGMPRKESQAMSDPCARDPEHLGERVVAADGIGRAHEASYEAQASPERDRERVPRQHELESGAPVPRREGLEGLEAAVERPLINAKAATAPIAPEDEIREAVKP